MYFVYIGQCADGSLYTGFTTDLEKRFKTHNSGKGAKYTRSRIPIILVYFETYEDKSLALKREKQIKSLTHKAKVNLINKP
ncbi:MAG: GIY-YIG nuclease family protein [Tissierellales bacterium]|nr:GIY-YIG nuclease family protein [Tissierellales bacterium]